MKSKCPECAGEMTDDHRCPTFHGTGEADNPAKDWVPYSVRNPTPKTCKAYRKRALEAEKKLKAIGDIVIDRSEVKIGAVHRIKNDIQKILGGSR